MSDPKKSFGPPPPPVIKICEWGPWANYTVKEVCYMYLKNNIQKVYSGTLLYRHPLITDSFICPWGKCLHFL